MDFMKAFDKVSHEHLRKLCHLGVHQQMLDWIHDFLMNILRCRGVYTMGGMVRDAPWRKLGGGKCVMIMMLLLMSIIIYYYMNTFITLHQCTFKHINIT